MFISLKMTQPEGEVNVVHVPKITRGLLYKNIIVCENLSMVKGSTIKQNQIKLPLMFLGSQRNLMTYINKTTKVLNQ